MKLTLVLIFCSFFIISNSFSHSYRNNYPHTAYKENHHQKRKPKLKKPKASIEFGDKSEITMYKDNPYYTSKSPSVSLKLGFNF